MGEVKVKLEALYTVLSEISRLHQDLAAISSGNASPGLAGSQSRAERSTIKIG